ncbi:MAG: hypothetical protein Kow00108_11840 [Calditrichia bacterium]
MHMVKSPQYLQDIPNVGPATEADLHFLGIKSPVELIGQDPVEMYFKLNEVKGERQDPCVLDVFISAVRFMEGYPPKKWWEYTPERKKLLQEYLNKR